MASLHDPEQDGPRRKKQNIGGEESLLEELRKMICWTEEPTNNEERLMEVVLRNQALFPSRLRPIITRVRNTVAVDITDTEAQLFCKYLTVSVEAFLKGLLRLNDGWNGPAKDIDTEDQIELVIRLFPNVLEKNALLFMLASSAKSVSFIPLVADLIDEFVETQVHFGLCPGLCPLPIYELVSELLNNTRAKKCTGIDADELHEESLDALVRLRERGHIEDEDVMRICAKNSNLWRGATQKSLEFAERRLRLLIEWNPSVLKPDYFKNLTPFTDVTFSRVDRVDYFTPLLGLLWEEKGFDIRLFETVWDMVMLHYPEQVLGFVLHGLNLKMACETWGQENAMQVISRRIRSALVQSGEESHNEAFSTKVLIKAATDDLVSLDGLYTLIRFDPGVTLSSAVKKRPT